MCSRSSSSVTGPLRRSVASRLLRPADRLDRRHRGRAARAPARPATARRAPAARGISGCTFAGGSASRSAPSAVARTRSRPPCLAAYSAPSARANSASKSNGSPAADAATPKDIVTLTPSSWRSRTACHMRSATSCAAARVQPGQQDEELLAAEAVHRLEGAHAVAHPAGHLAEHGIPDDVAMAVVDRLEVVDVADDGRDRPAGVGRLMGQLGQPGRQRGAVERAGEVVDERRTARGVIEVAHDERGERERSSSTSGAQYATERTARTSRESLRTGRRA